MSKLIFNGHSYTGGSINPNLATDVVYDNTDSGLTATDVQEAIDLLATEATVKQTDVTAGVSPSTTKYPLLLSGVSTSGTLVDGANKSDNLTYNPSTRVLMSYGTTSTSIGVRTTNNNITGAVYLTAGTSGNKSISFSNGSSTVSAIKCDSNNDISFSTQMQAAIIDAIISAIYPIGSIYMSVNNVNPGTYLTGTTWVAWGAGRVPVGVDATQTEFDAVEETGGGKTTSYTPAGTNTAVTLTAAQSGVPAHTHATAPMWAASSGAGSRNVVTGYPITSKAGGYNVDIEANTAKNATQSHNHTFKGTAANISTLQPYITCYMWKRTA